MAFDPAHGFAAAISKAFYRRGQPTEIWLEVSGLLGYFRLQANFFDAVRKESGPVYGTQVKLAKGDWVFYPRMPDWGYGKVLELKGETKGAYSFCLRVKRNFPGNTLGWAASKTMKYLKVH